MGVITIHVDGAIGNGEKSGIGAVARSGGGHFLGWSSRQLPAMTNNEAEYEAAILGLELAQRLGADEVEIVTDSQVVVQQMQGRSRVNSNGLQRLHRKACVAVRPFRHVRFRHVKREENRLADALASEALEGKEVRMRSGRGWRSRVRHLLAYGRK